MNKKTFLSTAAALVVVLGGAKAIDYWVGQRGSDLPACNAEPVVAMAVDIIKDNLVAQTLNAHDFEHPAESSYDSKAERRTCVATLKTIAGQERVTYTIQWHDKKANLFWLEFKE